MTSAEAEMLPQSWTHANLLEVSELIRGVTYSKGDATDSPADNHMGVLRANNITQNGLSFADLIYVPSGLVSDLQRVRRNDIVIATSSGSISVVGKAARAATDLNVGFGAFCGLIRPTQEIEARFVGHFFGSSAYRTYVSSVARGVNINNLKREHFENIEIPLPPLAEQVRIADKLDALLARVEAGRERLESVPKLLKRFRQSVLSAAVSGELTREWREEHEEIQVSLSESEVAKRGRLWGSGIVPALTDEEKNSIPKNWQWAKVGALGLPGIPAVQIGPMSMKSNQFTDSGHPVLNVGSVQSGYFNHEKLNYLSHSLIPPFKRYLIRSGDILFTRSGTIGRCAIATEKENGFLMTFHLLRVRVDQSICLPFYAFCALQGGKSIQRQIEESVIGATRGGFNTSLLEGLEIPLAPLEEQIEIVRRVEALFAIAERIEAKYAAALSSFDRLTPALLAKAFRGELVPQDPNDEPASVLLERIRAAREAEGGKRGRGRPAKAAAGSGEGAEVKRRGRPPGANAQAGAEGAEPKRRGRPPKVREAVSEPAGQPAAVPEAVEASAAPRGRGRPPGPGIPQASSFEDALRKLEEQKLARAQGARQVGLFDDAE